MAAGGCSGVSPGSDGGRGAGDSNDRTFALGRRALPGTGLRRAPPLADQSAAPRGRRQHGTVALGLAAVAGAAGSVYCGVEAIHYQRAAVAERAARAGRDRAAPRRTRRSQAGAERGPGAARRGGRQRAAEDRRLRAGRQLECRPARATDAQARSGAARAAFGRGAAGDADGAAQQVRSRGGAGPGAPAGGDARRSGAAGEKARQLAAEREKIATERDKAAGERDRLRSRVGELEQKLSLQQTRQPPRAVANAHTAPACRRRRRPRRSREWLRSRHCPRCPKRRPRLRYADPGCGGGGPGCFDCAGGQRRDHHAAPAEPAAPPVAYAPSVATPATAVSATPVAVTPAVTASALPAVSTPPAAAPRPRWQFRRNRLAAATPPVAYAAPAPQPQRPAAPAAVPAVAHGGIAQVERVLASAGVDVKNLFSQFGVNRGLGGPYIPNPRGSAAGDAVGREARSR